MKLIQTVLSPTCFEMSKLRSHETATANMDNKYKAFLMVSESKRVTECRDDRNDAVRITDVFTVLDLDVGIDGIQTAIGVVYAEVPGPDLTVFPLLDEVHSDVQTVIVRKFDIVRPGVNPVVIMEDPPVSLLYRTLVLAL